MRSAFVAAVFGALLYAQSAPVTPKFEVVSVKTCKPGVMVPGGSSPGRLHIGCGILANTDNTGLIQVAFNRYSSGRLTHYGVIPIEGAPDWLHSTAFEIDAKSDGQPSIQMMEGPMMQKLMEDRFKLKIHRETREGAVYNLVLGKGPLKLKPYEEGKCLPVTVGHTLSPLPASAGHYCRNMVGAGAVDFEGGTLSSFAGLLGGLILDRPILDKTGLTDIFEIHLKFSLQDSVARRLPTTAGAPVEDMAPDGPDIFQAVQEQLGLKLVPARGPVDVLVIDHIEKPSEN